MTDEEAIDNLKNYIECLMEDYGYYKDIIEFRDSVEHLEKSLQTQQAEIEHQKEKRENQKKELSILNEKQKEFNKLRNTVSSYKGQFKRQQAEIEKYKTLYAQSTAERVATSIKDSEKSKEDLEILYKGCQMELEKKDKIIDLMAEWLDEDDTSFGYGNLKDVNTSEKIKQYFERKVENGN